MITEYQQKPGQFEFSLVDDCPLTVRRSVPFPFGTVVVTTNRLPRDQTLTRAAVLGQARYSGVLRRQSNELRTLGGASIVVWLGNENGNGTGTYGAANGLSAVSWQTAVHAEFVHGGVPGITEGSHYTTNGTTINAIPMQTQIPVAFRAFFDPIAAQVGVEYRLRPDGTLDSAGVGVGQRDSGTGIYNNTPTVCLMRDKGGREQSIIGLQTTTLEVSVDYDSYTNSVHLYGTGVSGIWGTTSNWYDFGGTTNAIIAHAASYSSTSATDCQNAAQALEQQYVLGHREIRVSVNEYDISRFAIPGDYVYVWDPDSDIVDTTNPVQFRGQIIYPQKIRLLGYTWPLQQGMGIYTISSDGNNTVTDLTDFVKWETGADTTLDVDAAPRPLSSAVQSGPSYT